MPNIRVDVNFQIQDGTEIVFRSPCDCSEITGLIVYANGEPYEFAFADAHGNNVGDIDHLFAEDVLVKVILHIASRMAYVQNADTNAYIERTFIKTINGVGPDENGNVKVAAGGGGAANQPLEVVFYESTCSHTSEEILDYWISGCEIRARDYQLNNYDLDGSEYIEDLCVYFKRIDVTASQVMLTTVIVNSAGKVTFERTTYSKGGLADAEKTLILSLFRNAAYTSAGMGNVLTQLEALWNGGEVEPDEPDVPVEPDIPDEPEEPEVTLTSISASYSGGDVTAGTDVSSLTGIVVIAHYSDGTSETVTGYTLSGTIAEGSNTITVSYGGKTTTFTVTGVAESGGDATSPFDGTWTQGIYVSGGKENTGASWTEHMATDYVATDGFTNVVIENDKNKLFNITVNYYDSDKTYLTGGSGFVGNANYPSPLTFAIPDGTAYVRVSTKYRSGSDGAGWVYYTELKFYME